MEERYTVQAIVSSAGYAIPRVIASVKRSEVKILEDLVRMAKDYLARTPIEYNEHMKVEIVLHKADGTDELKFELEK